jgi:aldehyde:ferredoxin oxidoreductase
LKSYMGKLLRVDLTSKTLKDEVFEEEVARKFIGGSGIGAKILYEETNEKTDPLGPENVLIFMTGPLTGTTAPTSGRHHIIAKSPLTGIWGESDIGGHWGIRLKRAGYDGIIIHGKANTPVYLWINNDQVEIRDASLLWGKDTFEVDRMIREETHKKAEVASIGLAGEKLVRLACIVTGGINARVGGRCGLGVVMGSKNLKAIAVFGNSKVNVAIPDKFKEKTRKLAKKISEKTKHMHDYGTSAGMVTNEIIGNLPIRNWTLGKWEEGAQHISGQKMSETILTKNYYCGSCVIGCGRTIKLNKGDYAGVEQAGPEYETLACLGALCMIDDMESISIGNELCNRYGIDTISTGSVIAFAMELYEHGLISDDSNDGKEIKWGDSEIMIELIHKIAQRKGIGKLLGKGVKEAAKELGGLAHEFAIHSKGLEFPAHDPRAFSSLAVGYATSNRGACHLQSFSYPFEKGVIMPELGYSVPLDRFVIEGKGILTAKAQNLMCLFDSLKMCKFSLYGGVRLTDMLDLLNYATGWNMDIEEFYKAGERIFNLKRLYNVRCGISRKDDTLPPRILSQCRNEGGAANNLPHLGKMLNEYYEFRGWTQEGIPTTNKLEELDLKEYL